MVSRLVSTVIALAALCLPGMASAKWLRAETDNFILYSDGSETVLRDMAIKLEDYRDLLIMLTGSPAKSNAAKLEIYLVRSLAFMREMRGLSSSVAGFYSAQPEAVLAFSQRANTGLDRDDVLFHEYAHHFMMQYHATAYPAWYVEGFAEYMMTAQFKPKTIEFGGVNPARGAWIGLGVWIPMRKVLSSETARVKGSEGAMFYAESWLAVHYIFRTPGKIAALNRFLSDQAQGKPRDVAFKEAFGTDYDGFDRELKRYLSGGITYTIVTRASDRKPMPVTVTALSPSADDLLLPQAALRIGVKKEKNQGLLAQVRTDAAKYGEDPLARKVLARAELSFGDHETARTLLDKQIAATPADAEALYLRGRVELKTCADAKEDNCQPARRWFASAFKADDRLVPNLLAYVQCFPIDKLPENVLDVLLRARELTPQVEEIAVISAIALMYRGYFADAEKLLVPVVADAHKNVSGELAQLLDDARNRRLPGVTLAQIEKAAEATPPNK
jgi:tetratricopeptide (TPR) repeat protein